MLRLGGSAPARLNERIRVDWTAGGAHNTSSLGNKPGHPAPGLDIEPAKATGKKRFSQGETAKAGRQNDPS
jgi:hypothetical protein